MLARLMRVFAVAAPSRKFLEAPSGAIAVDDVILPDFDCIGGVRATGAGIVGESASGGGALVGHGGVSGER